VRGRAAGGERAGISIKIALPGLLEFATRPLPFSGRGGGAPALVGGLGVREQMSPHPLVTCRVRLRDGGFTEPARSRGYPAAYR